MRAALSPCLVLIVRKLMMCPEGGEKVFLETCRDSREPSAVSLPSVLGPTNVPGMRGQIHNSVHVAVLKVVFERGVCCAAL